MKEYTIIGNFKYKNEIYQLLIDNNKKYYFLKIKNGKQQYISLKELIELERLYVKNSDVLLIEDYPHKKKKIKLIPKIIIGTLVTTISLPLLSYVYYTINHHKSPDYTNTISYMDEDYIKTKTEEEIERVLSQIEKDKENFEVEDKLELLSSIIIYDLKELDDILGYKKEDITYQDIREAIENNPNISQKFKEIYLTLANNLERQYPTLDLRVWYNNLKTLKIEELPEMEMKIKAISANACACYRKDENVIYTVKDYDYVPGTWDYQVIIHEMCHPIRSSIFKLGDKKISINFTSQSGQGMIVEEAMNSIFSVRTYDKNERDIAYQLQSNMIQMILESMDNYTLQDFVEHNITYFEERLNMQNDNDEAVRMIALIQFQYDDFNNDRIEVDQTQFYDLYDYIARMYYKKRMNSNMSYVEAEQIRDEFIDRLTFDVPEGYHIDTNHIREFFNDYCKEVGIKGNVL